MIGCTAAGAIRPAVRPGEPSSTLLHRATEAFAGHGRGQFRFRGRGDGAGACPIGCGNSGAANQRANGFDRQGLCRVECGSPDVDKGEQAAEAKAQ